MTSAFYDDDMPVFDPAGNYLFYRSKRTFQIHGSDFDNTWAYVNSHSVICVPLRKDMPSPLAPKNDEEPVTKGEPKKEAPKDAPPKSNEPPKKPDDSRKGEPKSDPEKPAAAIEKRPAVVTKDPAAGKAGAKPVPPALPPLSIFSVN